jgi:dihydroflavonol-4-reductase
MPNTSLVTGANGHFGNNLVRLLLAKGERVIAGIRNPDQAKALSRLGSSVVHADLQDRDSLTRAFEKVDVLYQVGGVFKHWAPNPLRDIYNANLTATRNAIEAAAHTGIPKIVYVSSLATLDHSRMPITETTWNLDHSNVYYASKTDSEKLAWEMADQLGLKMVSVLPGTMIGGHAWSLTPPMALLQRILEGKLSVDPGFVFNFVDVRDVAEGTWLAATKGRAGERYLLANEAPTTIEEIVRLAQRFDPDRAIPTPRRLPAPVMYLVAFFMEMAGKVSRKEPELQRNYLRSFTVPEYSDIWKARGELGFAPKPPYRAILSALRYLAEEYKNDARLIRQVA